MVEAIFGHGRRGIQRVSLCSRGLHMLEWSSGKEELYGSEEGDLRWYDVAPVKGLQVLEVVAARWHREGWHTGELQ